MELNQFLSNGKTEIQQVISQSADIKANIGNLVWTTALSVTVAGGMYLTSLSGVIAMPAGNLRRGVRITLDGIVYDTYDNTTSSTLNYTFSIPSNVPISCRVATVEFLANIANGQPTLAEASIRAIVY